VNARLATALAAILVFGGGAAWFVVHRAAAAADEQRQTLLAAVEAELASEELDRASAARVLRDLRTAQADTPDPDLRRAEARLEMALGRAGDAWTTIGTVATGPDASTEDLEVGARVLARLHAERGSETDGRQALAIAREHARRTASVESQFLAWQLAYRVGDAAAFVELDRALLEAAADRPEGRTAKSIHHFLATHLADRRGLTGDLEQFAVLAADERAPEDERALSRFAVESVDDARGVDESALEALRRQWTDPPPELLVLIAIGRISSGAEADLHYAMDILRVVLDQVPSSIEARHAAAIAHHGLGETAERNAQLRWLLSNSSTQDSRRRVWMELQGS
jgi:hypothetical protein